MDAVETQTGPTLDAIYCQIKGSSSKNQYELCRICLYPIKTTNTSLDDLQPLYRDALTYIHHEQYPNPVVCPTCLAELKSVNAFIRKCRQSNKQVAEWIGDLPQGDESVELLIKVDDCPRRRPRYVYPNPATTSLFVKERKAKPTSPEHRCKICGMVFSCNRSMRLHSGTHRSDQSFNSVFPRDLSDRRRKKLSLMCEFCGKIYTKKGALNDHILSQHEGLVKVPLEAMTTECKVCGKFLKNITEHMKVHNPELKVYKFECEQCHKKFTRRRGYVGHMRTHDDPKFECDICGLKMRHPNSVKLHREFFHENKGGYTCTFCGRVYRHKVSLVNHVDKEHEGWVEPRVAVIKEEADCD